MRSARQYPWPHFGSRSPYATWLDEPAKLDDENGSEVGWNLPSHATHAERTGFGRGMGFSTAR